MHGTAADNLKGIVAMLIATAAFTVMDASMKALSLHYPPLQVTALRGFASLPFILSIVVFGNRWHELKPKRWSLHLLRGLLAVAMLALFIYGVRTLSLAGAYAVFLCGPLLVTALSVPLLGETVGMRRWLAICVGLTGVLAMLRPSAIDFVSVSAAAVFIAAVCYALGAILIRFAAATESTVSLSVSFLLVISLVSGAVAASSWSPVQPRHYAWIALLGVTGATGQYCIVEAFRRAPASVVAPFDYAQFVWGAMVDWLVWRTLPTERVLIGGGIVIATGLFLMHRERAVRRSIQPPSIQ